jgi:hypothetical protein
MITSIDQIASIDQMVIKGMARIRDLLPANPIPPLF